MTKVSLGDTYFNYELSKFIQNKYYSYIIYICINQGFVSAGDLRKLFGFNPRDYLVRLEKAGVIKSNADVDETFRKDLSHLSGMGRNSDRIIFYELSDKSLNLLQDSANYDLLCDFVNVNEIDKFYEIKNEEINKSKQYDEKLNRLETLRRIIAMKNQGIQLAESDLDIYHKWRYRHE